jgi:hypothetical protein
MNLAHLWDYYIAYKFFWPKLIYLCALPIVVIISFLPNGNAKYDYVPLVHAN